LEQAYKYNNTIEEAHSNPLSDSHTGLNTGRKTPTAIQEQANQGMLRYSAGIPRAQGSQRYAHLGVQEG
jgi:hypothetical protein